ncbi:MAG TPA: polysaccharide deacetylase family protein [bacterium]|nr:polysaccharide deacetylase family protein [bacterium]
MLRQIVSYALLFALAVTTTMLAREVYDQPHRAAPSLPEAVTSSVAPAAVSEPDKPIIAFDVISDQPTDEPVQPSLPITPESAPEVTPLPVFTSTPPELTRINTSEAVIVLTFDGGSGVQSLNGILTTLSDHQLQATFFLTGDWMEKNPDATKRIAACGHDIFNHTYHHPHLKQITDEEIVTELTQTDELLTSLTGKTGKPFFRPPYGERDDHILAVAAQTGYQSVYWTVDALDWQESEGRTAAEVKQRIYDHLEPGAIILMHIGDSLTEEALPEVIITIESQGYMIKPLSIVAR